MWGLLMSAIVVAAGFGSQFWNHHSLGVHSLPRDDTHKVDVINFAQNKATKCLQNESLIDKESASLLWKFIILLCRQNGVCSLLLLEFLPVRL